MKKRFTNLIALQLKLSMVICMIIIVSTPALANAVDIVVKGKVSGAQGPLQGVSVRVDGTSSGVTTDEGGDYTITAPENGILIFSYSGYKEQRFPVQNRRAINVSLEANVNELETVIVTG